MAVPSKIRPLGNYEKWMRMMLVAGPGFGKTVFGGTAPNCLFLTTDPEGTISALAMGSTAQEWKIESWTEFNDAYRYLRDGGIEEMGLEWLVIDNTSEAQNLGMVETMELARKRNANLDEFVPSQQDYQRSQNMLRQAVKKFNDLPVNILWTAWQKTEEGLEGDPFYAPGIHGQQGMLAQTIAGYMNIVGYGEVVDEDGDEVRRIWFTHNGPMRGKDRFNILGEYRDGLDIPKLMSVVGGAIKKYNKPTAPVRAAVTTKRPVAARRPVAKK